MKLALENDQGSIAQWVGERVPHWTGSFGPCTALGFTDDAGAPLAGAVYSDYRPEYQTVMISLAAVTARWATPNTIGTFLRYPFEQLKVNKLRAVVASDNLRSIKLTLGVGFVQEAALKDEFGPGTLAFVYRMMAKDYWRRWGNPSAPLRDAEAA